MKLLYILHFIMVLIMPIVLTVAFYVLTESKMMAAMQSSTGPNVVGWWGALQPIADGLKAIMKEQMKPLSAVFYLFLFAPMLTFLISLMALNFICFKFTSSYFDEYLNFLFFFSISSFNVFGIIFAGWTSNSKYTLLGALSAAAQTFSFEMCFITMLLPIFLLNSTFNLMDIVIYQLNFWNIFVFFPLSLYFFMILLAETNSTPFDLPEAEAELVAGYNLEYSAMNFALFFLGEYTNMLMGSSIFVIFFLGGWLPFFSNIFSFFFFNYYLISFFFFFKVIFMACLFILVSALLPSYRFDQLMDLCWKKMLPVSCSFFLFFVFYIYLFDGFHYNLEMFFLKPKNLTVLFFSIF